MPADGYTDITEDFLGIVARYQLIGSDEFKDILAKVDQRDPSVMTMIHTPSQTAYERSQAYDTN